MSDLGRVYQDGEIIVNQGKPGDCMYVIQSGTVEVFRSEEGTETRLSVLGEGDFFGEVPLIERENRWATVRAKGEVRVLTVDKRTFYARVSQDPTLMFRILETLSYRVRQLDVRVAQLTARLDATGDTADSASE